MTASIAQSIETDSRMPRWMIWVQYLAFVVLYAVWILPEVVGFRNTALVVGAVFGAYSIYQYRKSFLQKSAISIWLIVVLFVWATFHLVFISSNFPLQYIEYFRIWEYDSGGIIATGLGLALIRSQSNQYWIAIYFGLCTPFIIYLIKYVLTWSGHAYGLDIPAAMKVYDPSKPFYVPKTDYVAFCLPAFSIALGLLIRLSDIQGSWRLRDFLSLTVQILVISGTLFLFAAQNIKNGMAYAAMLFLIFGIIFCADHFSRLTWKKIAGIGLALAILSSAIVFNVKKNDSWRTLIADTKIGLQI